MLIADRFWAKVQKSEDSDGCWTWVGPTGRTGYGRIGFDGRRELAHRISWQLENGPIPEGLCVLHRCDVRVCVRPSHLFLGTRTDNAADRDSKGRSRGGSLPGERSTSAKLTAAKVAEIRRRYSAGYSTQTDLAKEYGVCQATVGYLVRGQTWKKAA